MCIIAVRYIAYEVGGVVFLSERQKRAVMIDCVRQAH